MILKKLEKNGKVKAIYASQTILGSTYDITTNELTVIFSNGGQYKYSGVLEADYQLFETTDSQGKTLNTTIKKYPFTKLNSLDANLVNSIKNEIEELKKGVDNSNQTTTIIDEKKLIFNMSFIVTEYLSTGKVNLDVLKEIKTQLTSTSKPATS